MDNQKLIISFLKLLGISEDNIEVNQVENTINIKVSMSDEDRGIFIGHHATTLDALQYTLSLMVNNQRDRDDLLRITLDIGDYRERRLDKIKEIVERAKNQASLTSLPVSIPRLSPTERRQVHVMLSEDDNFETYSEGEGSYRQLFIASKNQ